MNIQSMYSDIDLDANQMEVEFQASFEELMWFINKALNVNETLDVIFNRDVLVNESETINNCKSSVGIISQKTIITQHPWVNNFDEEIKQLEKENKELDPYPGDFGTKKVPDLNE